jgi:quinol monooxygenase YgiN
MGSEMYSQHVHVLIELAIREGKFEDFSTTVRSMTAGTAKEAGALGYEWFLGADRSSCRLLETYANAEAVQVNLAGLVVRELVPKLLGLATISRFEVYGIQMRSQ